MILSFKLYLATVATLLGLLTAFLFFSPARAQLQSAVWCIGDSTGLRFHPDGTISFENSIAKTKSKADASIWDKNGNLKFYYSTTYPQDDSSFIVNPNQPGLMSKNKISADFFYQGLSIPLNDSVYFFLVIIIQIFLVIQIFSFST